MKYTIEGLNQEELVRLGLDCVDAVILRFIIDFYHSKNMTKVSTEDGDFFWVSYKYVIDQLPIIKIDSKDVIARRMRRYVDAGIMEHYTHRERGVFSCYRFTEEYLALITRLESRGSDSEVGRVRPKSRKGSDSKVGTKDSSINNSSTNIPYPNILSCWNEIGFIRHNEQTWRTRCTKVIRDRVSAIGEEEVIAAIANYGKIAKDDAYTWTWSGWTLWEFIIRGLDKFLSSSDPFSRFKEKKRDEANSRDEIKKILGGGQ